jgi:hypothetical protein
MQYAWPVATVAVGLSAACGAALPAVPGNGGPTWIEVTSEHVTLWTDADPVRAYELIREIEQRRRVVIGVAFRNAPITGRALVIALRDDAELSAFGFNRDARAWASRAVPPLCQPMIVLSAAIDQSDRTVAHEVAHVVSDTVIRHQPRWLAEGIAEFFADMQIDEAGNGELGVVTTRRWSDVPITDVVPLSRLLAWHDIGSGATERSLYHSAAMLFAFLLDQHPAELQHYTLLLDGLDGPTLSDEHADGAWRTAFDSSPLAQLEEQLQQWLRNGGFVLVRFHVEPRDTPSKVERLLSDADVFALRGLLHGMWNHVAQLKADLAAARAADPTNVLAAVLTYARDEKPPRPAEGRALAAAHGDDWRTWWLASIALTAAQRPQPEIDAVAQKACALLAQNPALVAPRDLCAPTARKE